MVAFSMSQILLDTPYSSILVNPQINFLNYFHFLHVKMSSATGEQ